MNNKVHSTPPLRTQEEATLAERIQRIKEICEYCRPSTPLKCVTSCNIWKQKNELKKLYEKMQDPNFINHLLNALKNNRRLQLLAILSNGRHSIARLQRKIRERGYNHSQGTIAHEYVDPLVETGLAVKEQTQYHVTLFGCKLNELMHNSMDLVKLLPPHSKCYEERAIESLSRSPKTFKEMETAIPAGSLSRILKRLQEANLITKDKGKTYIFHFKTKRDPGKEKLSPTERRVYENIAEEGISSQELADKTNISLRRTYKYLRRLRGKKLVFRRKRPKRYSLTEEGMRIAELLENIQALLIEFAQASKELSKRPSESIEEKRVPDTLKATKEKLPQILAKPKA